jgi:dimethylhistidine N-methyltransferase
MDAIAENTHYLEHPANFLIHQLATPVGDDRATVISGLSGQQKQLPPKYFYDQTGSELFDRITDTPEYYPTRTERAIFDANRPAMLPALRACDVLIEPGSGNCEKAMPILDAGGMTHYVPIEISADFLVSACAGLARQRPQITVQAVCADFTECVALPESVPRGRRMVFFPGSTIGNFEPAEAARLLRHFHDLAGPGGYLLIGTDLDKDTATLEAAYNDAAGITAAFNLNLLAHLKRRVGLSYDPQAFSHRALYNRAQHRIEMHLVSGGDTRLSLADQTFNLRSGETIHTENSYKHSCAGFRELAEQQGFAYCDHWTDTREWFAVHLFRVPALLA